MALLPGLQPLADMAPTATDSKDSQPLAERPIAEGRAMAHAMLEQMVANLYESVEPAPVEYDRAVPVGGSTIDIRVYRPDDDTPLPVYVYIHGGGFWIGTLDHFDATCRRIVRDVGCVVVSVGYRLAPEFKFPVPVEDCYAALEWVAGHAAELGVDVDRLAVGGASAGGNLAAVISILSRDRSGPPITFQILEVPCMDMTMSHPSIELNADAPMLNKPAVRRCIDLYLADPADAVDPLASPLRIENLAGLPPALVMTAEYDPLRDEGEAYGRRLQEAGVPTTVVRWPGQCHGTLPMAKLIPAEYLDYSQLVASTLRKALFTSTAPSPAVDRSNG